MPPKARITQDMITDAAYELAKESGIEAVNARSIAERLGCSTQPVLYSFATVEDIKRSVYRKADCFHSEYIMQSGGGNPMLDIGMRYVRFAYEEKNLFRLLFQSDGFEGNSLSDLLTADELNPIIGVFAAEAELSPQEAGAVFRMVFMYVHGYASLLANNSMEYDEASLGGELERVFFGAMTSVKENNDEETV